VVKLASPIFGLMGRQ